VRNRSWSVPPGPAPCREKAHIVTQVIIYEHVHYSVRFHMYGHILLTTEMYQGYRGSLNMDTLPRISAACWWPPVTTDLLNHHVFLCILTAHLQDLHVVRHAQSSDSTSLCDIANVIQYHKKT